MTSRALTLIEVLASILVLTLAGFAVVGLVRLGMRQAEAARIRLIGVASACTVLAATHPPGTTIDAGDADGDGWELLDGTAPTGVGRFDASNPIDYTIRGRMHGLVLVRHETSSVGDILDPSARVARVTVDVYAGLGGEQVLQLRRDLLRGP
jgi:hypothetical protein